MASAVTTAVHLVRYLPWEAVVFSILRALSLGYARSVEMLGLCIDGLRIGHCDCRIRQHRRAGRYLRQTVPPVRQSGSSGESSLARIEPWMSCP